MTFGKRRTWHTGMTRLSAVSSKAYTGVTLSPSISGLEIRYEPILSTVNYDRRAIPLIDNRGNCFCRHNKVSSETEQVLERDKKG
jgi:hypothetical protein